MTEVPQLDLQYTMPPVATAAMTAKGLPVYSALKRAGDGSPVLGAWSGAGPVPAVGDTVTVAINDMGNGQVVGHYIQHGYLGVLVRLDSPPDWYIRQNGYTHAAHVFGAELVWEVDR